MSPHLHIAPSPPPAPEERDERQWLALSEVLDLGVCRRTAFRRRREGQWASREIDGRVEVLLDSLEPELQRKHREQLEERRRQEADLPASVDNELAYKEAGRRWELLQAWAALSCKQRKGAKGKAILEDWARAPWELVRQYKSLGKLPHPGSLNRVLSKVQRAFDAGRNGALLTLGRAGPRLIQRDPRLPDDAQAYVLLLYLKERAATAMQVYRAYVEESCRRDWPDVSPSTIRRVIDSAPRDVVVLARRGAREFHGKASPYISRDFSDLTPGEELVGDHRQFDFWVRCERIGRLFRPWLTAWQDHRSRTLPGWCMCEKPNSRTIMHAFAHAIRPKNRPEYERMCGIPSGIYVDNGKDYRSRALEGGSKTFKAGMSEHDQVLLKGLFPQLNIDITHAQPYNARAKIIERFFGHVADDFDSAIPGYCGHDTKDRTDHFFADVKRHKQWLKGQRRDTPFLTLAEVRDLFEAWLYKFHMRAHAGLSDGGRKLSPLDVYRLYGRAPELIRDHSLEFLLMERTKRPPTIQTNGIKLDGLWYRGDALFGLKGSKVEVRRDPEEAGRLYVFSLSGTFICEAINTPALRAKCSPEELAESIRQQKRQEKRVREACKTIMDKAPGDGMTLREAIAAGVPAPEKEPVLPDHPITRMVPELDKLSMRQVQPPAEVPAVAHACNGGGRPTSKATTSAGRRVLFNRATFEFNLARALDITENSNASEPRMWSREVPSRIFQ